MNNSFGQLEHDKLGKESKLSLAILYSQQNAMNHYAYIQAYEQFQLLCFPRRIDMILEHSDISERIFLNWNLAQVFSESENNILSFWLLDFFVSSRILCVIPSHFFGHTQWNNVVCYFRCCLVERIFFRIAYKIVHPLIYKVRDDFYMLFPRMNENNMPDSLNEKTKTFFHRIDNNKFSYTYYNTHIKNKSMCILKGGDF